MGLFHSVFPHWSIFIYPLPPPRVLYCFVIPHPPFSTSVSSPSYSSQRPSWSFCLRENKYLNFKRRTPRREVICFFWSIPSYSVIIDGCLAPDLGLKIKLVLEFSALLKKDQNDLKAKIYGNNANFSSLYETDPSCNKWLKINSSFPVMPTHKFHRDFPSAEPYSDSSVFCFGLLLSVPWSQATMNLDLKKRFPARCIYQAATS